MRNALVSIALLASAGRAHAEGDRALSVSLNWATFSTTGKAVGRQAAPTLSPDVGGAVAVSYEHQLSTDVGLRAELAGGMFYGGAQMLSARAAQSDTSYALLGDAGVVFRFDVLKFVPYAFAGLGGVASGGGPIDRGADFVLVAGGGVDWLQNRARSLGVEARIASFGDDITVITFGLRGTTRWGFL